MLAIVVALVVVAAAAVVVVLMIVASMGRRCPLDNTENFRTDPHLRCCADLLHCTELLDSLLQLTWTYLPISDTVFVGFSCRNSSKHGHLHGRG